MTELVLDGTTIKTESDFHDQIAANPATPDFYGRNLDALNDVLLGFFESPVEIVWHNAGHAAGSLGERYAEILAVFEDAKREWVAHGGCMNIRIASTGIAQ